MTFQEWYDQAPIRFNYDTTRDLAEAAWNAAIDRAPVVLRDDERLPTNQLRFVVRLVPDPTWRGLMHKEERVLQQLWCSPWVYRDQPPVWIDVPVADEKQEA